MGAAATGGPYVGGSGVIQFRRPLTRGILQAVSARTPDTSIQSGEIFTSIYFNRGLPEGAAGETLLASGYVTQAWSPSWSGLIDLLPDDELLLEVNGTASANIFLTALINSAFAQPREPEIAKPIST